jgi:chromosome segregation ATPase
MPAPNAEPPTGWIAALAALVGGVIVAFVNVAGSWRQELIKRRTATEQQKLDREENYTENLRDDLERLTTRFDALIAQRDVERMERVAKETQLAEANVEQKRKIAHLETVIEQLEFQIKRLEDKKLEYDKMLAQKDAIIAEMQAIIEELQEQIADFGAIGKTEPAPPKRAKETEE